MTYTADCLFCHEFWAERSTLEAARAALAEHMADVHPGRRTPTRAEILAEGESTRARFGRAPVKRKKKPMKKRPRMAGHPEGL